MAESVLRTGGAGSRSPLTALRRMLGQIGPIRLYFTCLFLLVASLLARFSWDLPLAGDAERALYDMRFNRAVEVSGQDERIVLVYYDDNTLRTLGKRSPLDRKMLADALRTLDTLKPKAIGIDILFDQEQAEDPLLIEQLREMERPVWLGFATAARNPDQVEPWQEEFLRGFMTAVASGPVRPASIRLEEDVADGVIRRWPDSPEGLPPFLPIALAGPGSGFSKYRGAINFRMPAEADRGVFRQIPIDFVAIDFAGQPPEELRAQIAGRYVLIGGNIKDLDDFETPMTRASGRWTKGLEVHAHLLAQLLDARARTPIPSWTLWIAAGLLVLAGALTSLLESRRWVLAFILAGQIAWFGGLPFLLEGAGYDTLGLPAFGWGLGWVLAYLAVGTAARSVGSEQKRFAQSTLGKYLPVEVAAEILRDPSRLALTGEKRRIFALFTDIQGFTELSHKVTPEALSELLNRYLDTMSAIILDHGGTIDKFVGDAVVAFWGAPIARDDDGDRAVRAAIALFEAGEGFRQPQGDAQATGCTRVGLHLGEAVVGNFGGKGRIAYTALGDGMNTAARLEGANKALKTTILVSAEARKETKFESYRPMGRIVLIGRATPVVVWEPVPAMGRETRERLCEAWARFDTGDKAGLREIEKIAAANKDDAALQYFVYRIRKAGPGGSFALASK